MRSSLSFPVCAAFACAFALVPSLSLAAGGFKCAVVAPDTSHAVTFPGDETLFVLHAGDTFAPTSAAVVVDEGGALVSKSAQVTSTGSMRLGKVFNYALADAPEGTSLSVGLPGLGACGRGACDLDASPTATFTKGGSSVAYTCTSL